MKIFRNDSFQETSLRTSWWLEPTYLFSPSLLFSSSSSSSFSSFLTSHATGFDREVPSNILCWFFPHFLFLNNPPFPSCQFSFPRRDPPVVSESASVQEAGRTQCESGAERADRLLVKVRMVLVLVRMPWNTSREISLLIHTHHDGTVYNAVEQINIMLSFLRPKIEDGGGKRGSQVIC